MNLDQLTDKIAQVSPEKLVQALPKRIKEWKDDDRTVDELVHMVEHYFGNTWIPSEEDHSTCYRIWKEFKENVISGLGGMTINERLYHFGLFDRYESCPSREDQLNIYTKLHAKP